MVSLSSLATSKEKEGKERENSSSRDLTANSPPEKLPKRHSRPVVTERRTIAFSWPDYETKFQQLNGNLSISPTTISPHISPSSSRSSPPPILQSSSSSSGSRFTPSIPATKSAVSPPTTTA